MVPFVDFRKRTTQSPEASPGNLQYYDDRKGKNVWEYFFAPVSHWKIGCPGNVTDESKELFEALHMGEQAGMNYRWSAAWSDDTPSIQDYKHK